MGRTAREAPTGGRRDRGRRPTPGWRRAARRCPGTAAASLACTEAQRSWGAPVGRSGRAGDDDGLDAAVELRREHVVSLGDVLERDVVGDDIARLEVAVAD